MEAWQSETGLGDDRRWKRPSEQLSHQVMSWSWVSASMCRWPAYRQAIRRDLPSREFQRADNSAPQLSRPFTWCNSLRDEAHRFAITYHRQRRSKTSVRSAVDQIPGIGPKRRRMLLQRFGSVAGIKQAALDEIAAIPGMTVPLARTVKEYL